jgi:ferric-dicitrate binding protein FerR (iron transport regulator)
MSTCNKQKEWMSDMKSKTCIIILLACVMATVSVLQAADTIAVIVKTQGKVTMTRLDADPVEIKRGQRLQDGDKLVTGKKSFAALRFIDDASLVRVGENTVCTVHGQKSNNQVAKNIALEAGALLSRVRQLKGKFQVSTPTSVASVKGTEFIAEHKSNPGTYYFGEEGEVEVTNEAGTMMLEAGFTVYVASATSMPEKWKTKSDEKPDFEGTVPPADEFEIEFEDESGQKKTLKFKVQEK